MPRMAKRAAQRVAKRIAKRMAKRKAGFELNRDEEEEKTGARVVKKAKRRNLTEDQKKNLFKGFGVVTSSNKTAEEAFSFLGKPQEATEEKDTTKAAKEEAPTSDDLMAKYMAKSESSWSCSVCMISNSLDKSKCDACEAPNPKAAAPKSDDLMAKLMTKSESEPAKPTFSIGCNGGFKFVDANASTAKTESHFKFEGSEPDAAASASKGGGFKFRASKPAAAPASEGGFKFGASAESPPSVEAKVQGLEDQVGLLVRRVEQGKQELLSARAEIQGVKERAREMLLAQGAELSRASLYICGLQGRLEALLGEEEGGSDPPSEEASDPASRLDLCARRNSQFLVTPTEGGLEREELLSDFGRAMMVTSTGSEGLCEPSLSSLASAIQCREELEGEDRERAAGAVPGLVEQLGQVDSLLARLVAGVQAQGARSQENLVNGNSSTSCSPPPGQVQELEAALAVKEAAVVELRAKFGRNRQILTCNWEQAEAEVRRLDDIYHETVDSVVRELAAAPDVLVSHPGLAALATSLQQARMEQGSSPPQGNGNGGSPPQGNGNANLRERERMSRSMVTNGSNGGDSNTNNVMSQSQGKLLTNSNTSSGLSQSILSDPCLLKSPAPSLPSLLAEDRARQHDMNANQSL